MKNRLPWPFISAGLLLLCFLISAIVFICCTGCARHYETEAQAKMVHARDVSKYQARMNRAEHELAWWQMQRDLADFEYVQCWGYLATENMETNQLLFNASFDRFIADEDRLWLLERPAEYHAYMDSRTNRLK